MKYYTDYIDSYTLPKEDFIKKYVLDKEKYIVKLANGTKITVPKTQENKNFLDEKISKQIKCISEEDIKKIKENLNDKLFNRNAFIIFILTFIVNLFPILTTGKSGLLGALLSSLIPLSCIPFSNFSYMRTKKTYEEIIKNIEIINEAESINFLLSIKNLTIINDLSHLFKGCNKKVIKKFIKNNKEATINSLDGLSLKELLSLKKAALNYKRYTENFDDYEKYFQKNKVKIKENINK